MEFVHMGGVVDTMLEIVQMGTIGIVNNHWGTKKEFVHMDVLDRNMLLQ
jgi:hypothetical protein